MAGAPNGRDLRGLRALEALRHRDFRLLWTGQTVSLIGDGAFLTALGWKTFTIAGSSRLGVVLLCNAIGLLTTLLIGGALGDRLSRKALMIASDFWRFGAVAILAGADATGHLSFELLIVLATLVGLGDGLFYPAFGGMVPLVVDPSRISSANSLIGVSRWTSLLIGPALAAGPYHATGSATVFAIDATTFILSAALLSLARPRVIDTAASEGTLREIGAGVRYVAGVPWLWVTITLFALVLMLQLAPQQVLLPELVRDHFGRGVGAFGFLTSMLGLGTVLGTLSFGQLQPRGRRGVLSYWIWVVNSLCLAGVAFVPWFAAAAGLSVVRGFLIGFGVALWETMMMELVPDRLLSRVVSLDYFGSYGLMPVGLALSAGASGFAGPAELIGGGAILSALLFLVALRRPWLRDVD
jgi:MFS family permease